MVERRNCYHKRLTFGSGGYYIICLDCGSFWRCQDKCDFTGDKVQYMRDFRIDPEQINKIDERAQLESEVGFLRKELEEIPEYARLTRMSLAARLQEVETALKLLGTDHGSQS